MELIANLNEYKILLRESRQYARNGISNNYLSISQVERYINLGRLYYEKHTEALLFYTDEEEYYRLLYTGTIDSEEIQNNTDKPIYLRYVYTDKEKSDRWINCVKRMGFQKCDSSVQIISDISKLKDVEKKLILSIKHISRFGLHIQYATQDMYDSIICVRDNESIFNRYYFDYETKEEVMEDIRQGYYRVVLDSCDNVVAVQYFLPVNGTINGEWLAVKEEYKTKYGIGAALAYHSYQYARDRGVKIYTGWVDVANTNSLKYHETLGYTISGKKSEGWIMESKG